MDAEREAYLEGERRFGIELDGYRGKWVAVFDQHVVFSSDDLSEVFKEADAERIPEDSTILKVPTTDVCMFMSGDVISAV